MEQSNYVTNLINQMNMDSASGQMTDLIHNEQFIKLKQYILQNDVKDEQIDEILKNCSFLEKQYIDNIKEGIKKIQLKYKCSQSRLKIQENYNKLKETQKKKKYKQIQVKIKVDQQIQQRQDILQKQIFQKENEFKNRQVQLQSRRKNILTQIQSQSLKDLFQKKKADLDQQIQLFNNQVNVSQAEDGCNNKNMNTQQDNYTFNTAYNQTTNPICQNSNLLQVKTQTRDKDYTYSSVNSQQQLDKSNRHKQIENNILKSQGLQSPLANKEIRENILNAHKRKLPTRCPGIGIEKTPIYKIRQEQIEQQNAKQLDQYKRLKDGLFETKQQKKMIDFKKIHKIVNEITHYNYITNTIQKDPTDQNIFNQKLENAVQIAKQVWGNQKTSQNQQEPPQQHSSDDLDLNFQPYQSLPFLENSLQKFLQQQQNNQQQQQKVNTSNGRNKFYLYTQHHKKVQIN